ncbi:MAG: hypothetical protein MI749_02285, partial [Desulfovibrionales bacterium]|nr:hypothetical protein [Desulfovibrionales bacterium]
MKKWRLFTLVFFLFGALVLVASFLSCSSRELFSEAQWAARVEATQVSDYYAPHVDDGTYFAPWMAFPPRNFFQVMRWRFFTPTSYTKEEREYLPRVLEKTRERLEKVRGDFILWIGHNTFLV